MPNLVAEDKYRISYIEWLDTYEELKHIAKSSKLDLSDLIREATRQYVERHSLGATSIVAAPAVVPKSTAAKKKKPVAQKRKVRAVN